MKILFDNVNPNSKSGPNSFARKLISEIDPKVHQVGFQVSDSFFPDVQLSFICSFYKFSPIVQRLDGIYFNLDQDYEQLNQPILDTFQMSDAVIYQTDFNKKLSEKWFGEHNRSFVIRNGAPVNLISDIEPLKNNKLDEFENIWTCASSWRPHKRLSENVRYFLESSSINDCLVIAGSNPDYEIVHPRVFYAGMLDWHSLISLYKRSSHFIHLAWLDHCPNVVIDARASGCHIVCSSSGGTAEIAGKDSTIIQEDEWDLNPVKLYSPPIMDFSNKTNTDFDSEIDMSLVASRYIKILEEVSS